MVAGIMFPPLAGKANSMVWNLSQPVGSAKPNKIDDVEFVRFGYFLMKTNPTAQPFLTARERAALASLQPQGAFAPDLAECIAAHEQSRGGPQDGFVSAMRDLQANKGVYDHKHKWIVMALNTNMIQMTAVYPRIDLHISSGPAISRAFANICNFKK